MGIRSITDTPDGDRLGVSVFTGCYDFHSHTGSNIQYEFLRLISGAVTPLLAKRSESETYPAEFNSHGTLFTFAGAFTGLDEIVKRLNKDESGMGFEGANFDKLSELEHFIFRSGCLYMSMSQLCFNLFSQKHFE